MNIPHEINLSGVYVSPLLVAAFFGFILAIFAARLMNKYNLARYFSNVSIVFLSMVVIFTMLVEYLIVAF